MKLKIAISLTFCIISVAAMSQKIWTLSDCIEYAHTNNLQIKRTELQAEVAEINLLQSKINLFPDLNGNLDRRYNFGRTVDPTSNQFTVQNYYSDGYSITSNVTLFAGLRNYNNIKQNQYAQMAAFQDVEKEKIEQTLDIATAYLGILYQQELVEVARSQQEVTQLQVERTGKLVEAGSVAKGDLLEMQAQLANENLNVTNSQNQLQLSVLNLVQLLDLDSAGGFNVVTPDTIDPATLAVIPDAYDVYADALNYLPHVKSAAYKLQRDEKILAIRKGARSPYLYMQGTLGTGFSSIARDPINQSADYPYSDQLQDNFGQSLSLGVSVPIVNNWEVNSNISRARIQVEDSEYVLEQVQQQLYKNIQQAHTDALSAREKYKSASEAVNSYREAFHYTEQKFNVGIVNSVEYNISKNNFIKAESELLQAKYEYIFSNKILDFYRGIPFSL